MAAAALRAFVLGTLLALANGAAAAAHITDLVSVGLYATPRAEGTPLQLVSSGTPVETLARRDGFVRVRLVDGTEGWIEAGYVTDAKPAAAELRDTRARLRLMGLELAALREAHEAANANELTHAPEAAPTCRSWVFAIIALVIGFVAGAAFVDYRARKRHGGFRV